MNAKEKEKILTAFDRLPIEAQKNIADLINLLQQRNKDLSASKNAQKKELALEKFIGIWKDRKDFGDSTEWVRDTQENE